MLQNMGHVLLLTFQNGSLTRKDLKSSVFTFRSFKGRSDSATVIRRCAESDVVRSTEPSPSLTGN